MSNLISTCPDKCERRLVILARERTGNSEFILLYVLKDGNFVRYWSLDEFPQFFRARPAFKPGITGM